MSWKSRFASIVVTIGILPSAAIAYAFASHALSAARINAHGLAGAAIFLPAIAAVLWRAARIAIDVYFTRYRLTTQRLFVTRGLIARAGDELELYRIEDFRVEQTIFDRLFGIGDIVLLSTDRTTPAIRIFGLAEPERVKESIRTQVLRLREGRVSFFHGV